MSSCLRPSFSPSLPLMGQTVQRKQVSNAKTSPTWLTASNSPAMTYVIITGGIDLSVGSVVGLGGMIGGYLIQKGLTVGGYTLYFSVPMVILIVILPGCAIGWVNGAVITKLRVAPFIATLGTMYICRGFANIISTGRTFSSLAGYEGLGNTGFKFMGSSIMGIPVGAVLLIILSVITAVILRKTTFGWHVYAVGGNERAARMSGIKPDRVKIYVYMLSGACAALVGIILAVVIDQYQRNLQAKMALRVKNEAK